MPKKQDNLIQLLCDGKPQSPPKLNVSHLKSSPYYAEIFNVYRDLGGILDSFPCRLGKWDCYIDGTIVELDEQLHFNRYRHQTLESSLYSELTNFPREQYSYYCREYEDRCLAAGKHGGKWTNDSCEKQFGPSSPHRDYDGLKRDGAPRWKQRAFYDFIKDLSPMIIGVNLVRISIWDELSDEHGDSHIVKDLLENDHLVNRNKKGLRKMFEDLIQLRKGR